MAQRDLTTTLGTSLAASAAGLPGASAVYTGGLAASRPKSAVVAYRQISEPRVVARPIGGLGLFGKKPEGDEDYPENGDPLNPNGTEDTNGDVGADWRSP